MANIISYITGTAGAFAMLYIVFRPKGDDLWSMLKGCMIGGLVGILLSMFLLGCAQRPDFYTGLYPALEREGVFKQ